MLNSCGQQHDEITQVAEVKQLLVPQSSVASLDKWVLSISSRASESKLLSTPTARV